jgi:hypothetical protein
MKKKIRLFCLLLKARTENLMSTTICVNYTNERIKTREKRSRRAHLILEPPSSVITFTRRLVRNVVLISFVQKMSCSFMS